MYSDRPISFITALFLIYKSRFTPYEGNIVAEHRRGLDLSVQRWTGGVMTAKFSSVRTHSLAPSPFPKPHSPTPLRSTTHHHRPCPASHTAATCTSAAPTPVLRTCSPRSVITPHPAALLPPSYPHLDPVPLNTPNRPPDRPPTAATPSQRPPPPAAANTRTSTHHHPTPSHS